MTLTRWSLAMLLGLFLTLGGCSGPFKFSDDDYRPLGDPAFINRGK
jgi:hypothetical protein